jgi:antitoxin PrlF
MKSTVSEKGQVTIPKNLRDRLGLVQGTVLEFKEERGRLVAVKTPRTDAVDALYGVLQLEETTDQLLAGLRGEREGE